MARFLLDMADSDQLAFLFLPQVTLDIQEFHPFYWVFFLLQNQGHGYPLCSRRTVERHSGDTQERRAAVGSYFGGLVCAIYAFISIWKKEGKRTSGKKAEPEAGHPGAAAGPDPNVWLELFHYKRFSPHCKINLQHQR